MITNWMCLNTINCRVCPNPINLAAALRVGAVPLSGEDVMYCKHVVFGHAELTQAVLVGMCKERKASLIKVFKQMIRATHTAWKCRCGEIHKQTRAPSL